MRILPSLLSLALASTVVTGCTTKKYYTTEGGGDGGTTTGAPASVSDVQPAVAFTGRTLDVTLTGSNTSWDATTTVDFGAGITVNKLTVASAAGIVANVTIADSAATGPRDVTVTAGSSAEPYKMTFTVNTPVAVVASGDFVQGSIFSVVITNNDPLNHPFDATNDGQGDFTNLALVGLPNGVNYQIENATTTEIDLIVLVDTTATTGAIDLDLLSGPNAQATTPAGDEFKFLSAFTIAATTSFPVLADNTAVAITPPFGSKMFMYTPKAAGDFMAFATNDSGNDTIVALLDSTGSFQNLKGSGASVFYTAPDTTVVYVLVWDAAGAGAVSATANLVDIAQPADKVGGEGVDTAHQNDTIAGAVALTPPTTVAAAQLYPDAGNQTTSDLDTYKVTVTANQHIYAYTSVSGTDANTLTAIQFLDSTGTPIADGSGSTDPSDPFGFAADSTGPLAAGIYYIQISMGGEGFGTYDVADSHYNLTVVVQ